MEIVKKILMWIGIVLAFFTVVILIGSIGDRYKGVYFVSGEYYSGCGSEYREYYGVVVDSALVQTTCYPTICDEVYELGVDKCLGSCVICGYDTSTCLCYETGYEFIGDNKERRKTVEAINNVDYKINSVTASAEWGYIKELGILDYGANITKYNIGSFIKNVANANLKSKIFVTICFTNYVELSSVTGEATIYLGSNYVTEDTGTMTKGNSTQGGELFKSLNIQPGTHYITMVIDLSLFDLLRVNGDSTVEFEALKYED